MKLFKQVGQVARRYADTEIAHSQHGGIALSPDNRTLAVGTDTGSVETYSIDLLEGAKGDVLDRSPPPEAR